VPDLFIRGAGTYTAHINAGNPVGTMQSISIQCVSFMMRDTRRRIQAVSGEHDALFELWLGESSREEVLL